jgi:hypothetical protein
MQTRRATEARRLKTADREVDFFFINNVWRGLWAGILGERPKAFKRRLSAVSDVAVFPQFQGQVPVDCKSGAQDASYSSSEKPIHLL